MNYSGILVLVNPERTDEMAETLNALPGVEVFQRDPGKGRMVLVQEASNIDSEVDGLRRIQTVPGVTLAEMVYHYFEEDDSPLAVLPEHLPEGPGLAAHVVPSMLAGA